MTRGGLTDLEQDDTVLVARSVTGDYDAFRALYEKHVSRVYAICFRCCGDEDEASDIAQEVFVQVWGKLKNFRGDSSFSTWLYRVATNISVSYIRKRNPWWSRTIEWTAAGDEKQMQKNETYFEYSLDKKIADLPQQARLVFVLFAIEGYRHAEIAKVLKISVGTSKAQYHRARQILKERLKNE